GLDSATQRAELAALRAREVLSETPEQRLDTWIALSRDRGHKDARAVQSAAKYVEWLGSKEAKASPQTRAKAPDAPGPAQRNQGQYAEAVKSLKQAVDAAQALKVPPAWTQGAEQTLKELTDPSAYFLPRAKQLREEGRLKEALAELKTGAEAMPDNPRLA